MRQFTHGRWVYSLGLLVASLAVAAVVRHLLDPFLHDAAPYTVFLVAVAVCAWYGGLTFGLLATAAGAAMGIYFFLSPRFDFAYGQQPWFLTQLLVFVGTGGLISILGGARLAAMRRLEQTVQRLRWMGAELTLVEDRQRRAIAQALHDHLQQLLVASRLKLGRLRTDRQPDDVRQTAAELDDLVSEAISYTRTLTAELSPSMLYSEGLGAALRALAPQVQQRYGLKVTVEADADAEPADASLRVLLFQATRELLFNVAKHAKVDEATVRLARRHGRVEVVVEDGGVGIVPNAKPGLGLMSIEERLRVMGGTLRLSHVDATGRGTRAVLTGPIEPPTAQAVPPAPQPAGSVAALPGADLPPRQGVA